jgi:hypothetical protein
MNESRIKKFAVIGLTLLAILVVGVSLVAAQGPLGDDTPVAPATSFIDEDGDGQCDLYGTDQAGTGGAGYGQYSNGAIGADFVDEDGDGQCDLMDTGTIGQGQGFGAYGTEFVDEDGDGTCDLAGSGQSLGQQGRAGNGFRGGAGNGLGMSQGARGTNAAQ